MKLFLTGDDGVAAALGFEKLEREREFEWSKRSEPGARSVYRGSEKLFTRGNRMNVPLALLIRVTYVTHILRGGDCVGPWVNRYVLS